MIDIFFTMYTWYLIRVQYIYLLMKCSIDKIAPCDCQISSSVIYFWKFFVLICVCFIANCDISKCLCWVYLIKIMLISWFGIFFLFISSSNILPDGCLPDHLVSYTKKMLICQFWKHYLSEYYQCQESYNMIVCVFSSLIVKLTYTRFRSSN